MQMQWHFGTLVPLPIKVRNISDYLLYKQNGYEISLIEYKKSPF